jgi:uncharacterized protein (TIGR03437 family)
VAVDLAGNVFIADRLGDRVRRVDAVTGLISTYAGDGPVQFSGDGELAVYSQLAPADVAVDSRGNVYIADGNNRVRKVDAATGIIHTIAGNGSSGFSGDGGSATAAALGPVAVALDAAGNLFIGDAANRRVRKVDVATGIITTFAGGGRVNSDHGSATTLQLASVSGIAVDSSGNVYVSDALDARVYKIDRSTGMMHLVAGTYGLKSGGDGGPGTSAPLGNPQSIAVDRSGNLYIADLGDGRVRRVDAMTGIITTVAGTVTPTVNGGDGGPATSAQLFEPSSVALDSHGNLFISEKERGYIRRVDAATHNISTIAGTATCCLPGDDGILATLAYLSFPQGLAVGPGGKIYFAEPQGRVRLLTPIPLDEPVIGAVENGASFTGPISPGAWIAIWGANLSPSTRAWTASDFHGNSLPLSLDGISVTVDGKPAAISYVSPGQINAQCPDLMLTGTSTSANVQVVAQGHVSNVFTAQVLQLAPALFSVKSPVSSGTWYAAAVHSDGALVGDPGGWGIASTRPAVGGEVISVFGTGFGPSTPPIHAGSLPTKPEPLVESAQIIIGNTTAQLTYAGIVGPGLVQLNFVVPTQYASGLQLIQASVNSVFTPYIHVLFLPVRKD